jgi:lysophospholipase L1-like esterase
MLGSRFALQQRMPGIYVNAAVSRQWYTAPSIAGALGAAGYLRQTVVVHLGTNGAVTNGGLDKLLDELGPARRVLLVNARVDRPWEQLVNQRLSEAAGSHPNVRLVDWYSASDGHPEYFVHDGVHLTVDGAHAYANLIAGALR